MVGRPDAFERFLKIYRHRDLMFKTPVAITRIPLVTKLMALMPKMPALDDVHLTYIPVNKNIETPPGTVAPITVMETFIKKASYHVILNECPCRAVAGCKDYPIDFGCTFLGEGAREINPAFSKHVTAEEALEYLHKTVEAGLVPALGRFIGDSWMLNVKDHAHLMTMCHCCPCCCLSTYLRDMPEELGGMMDNSLIKLEGVSVDVNENCTGCGTCEKKCTFGMIKVVDKKAVISEHCKGCGRCAIECPSNAIDVKVDNPDYIEQAVKRISKVIDVEYTSQPS